RADAGRRAAGAGIMALVQSGAGDGVRAGADSGLAGIGLRAFIAVIAGRAVGLRWVRADAGRRIARAGYVTLIGGGAIRIAGAAVRWLMDRQRGGIGGHRRARAAGQLHAELSTIHVVGGIREGNA